MANELINKTPITNTPNKTPFSVVEAYKNIRVRIVTDLAKINGKIIAISSTNASEGKSTTAINTAITLSQLNKKVLLIDGDTRRSTIHHKLKINNELGFLDLILGNSSVENTVKSYSPYLDVLTAGTAMSNPAEILSSSAFERVLTEFRNSYDYVVIDTPPINMVSDASVIAQKCDGLVMVVRAGSTTYEDFKHASTMVEELNINFLGVIMNGVETKGRKKYYKYKYKYGY